MAKKLSKKHELLTEILERVSNGTKPAQAYLLQDEWMRVISLGDLRDIINGLWD